MSENMEDKKVRELDGLSFKAVQMLSTELARFDSQVDAADVNLFVSMVATKFFVGVLVFVGVTLEDIMVPLRAEYNAAMERMGQLSKRKTEIKQESN